MRVTHLFSTTSTHSIGAALIASLLLSSCASFRGPAYEMSQEDEGTFTQPLRQPKALPVQSGSQIRASGGDANEGRTLIVKAPRMGVSEAADVAKTLFIPKLKEEEVSRQTYNELPIPAFINEVYGNQLGLDFVLQPSVSSAPDLVTLRLNNPMSQKDLYVLASNTLARYGVTTFEQDGVLVFDYSEAASDKEAPLIVTGRALPEVPSGNRPIFYVYPLIALSPPQVRTVLSSLFNKNAIEISEDIPRNALLLKGKPQRIQEAVAAIQLLDKPSMAGFESIILQPVVNSVKELSTNLQDVLKTEGFLVREGAGNEPVRFLPLSSSGQLVVFAKSEDVLDHIVDWAEKLETQRKQDVKDGLFSYQVQSTKAEHIAKMLQELGVGQVSADSGSKEGESSSGVRSSSTGDASRGRYAVDEQLNTILFSGSGKNWVQSLELIKRLDKPAPSVMVEVILAEVSLEESENSAIEWLFNSTLGRFDVTGSTIGRLAEGTGALNLVLKNGAQTRAALNLLYKNSRSTIRSRPRVMVKSGESASINVGDRVPTVTSNVQSDAAINTNVIQNVSYVETGVILKIEPTVHATGFVDIGISQELSEALQTETSSINSPTIRTRSIETTLSLRDGGSVLIGGLIRANDSNGETGVPILGKLPVLGKLFRGDTMGQDRTELMVMIIPYILNTPEEVESLTDELQNARMEELERF